MPNPTRREFIALIGGGCLLLTVKVKRAWGQQAAMRGRSLPALMCGSDEGVASNITCTWPPKRSLSAGDEPRYGPWIISTSAIILNNSPVTWLVDPLPADAMLILPGLALA